MLFNFEDDYILENQNVLLRPLATNDFEHLLHFALDEPDTWTYSLVSAAGYEGMKNYIDSALEQRKLQKEYPFIVFDKLTNKYAGCTRFYDIQLHYNSLQLGYTWYGQQFRGTGLNKNCKLLLLEFAFEKMQVERVEFRADNNNETSKAAMKSIGCTVEGLLRNHMPTATGGRRDSIILSILKNEWNDGMKNKLLQKINK